MHAAHPRIDVGKAGGDARQRAARIERGLGDQQRFLGGVGEGLDLAFAPALLGDLVELGLGAFDLFERLDVLRRVERSGDEVAADRDQAAEQREIVDLRGEIARRDQRRARAGELGEVGRPADLPHRLVGLEQGLQGDRIGDHVAIGEAKDRLVDAAVQRLEEMVGAKLELDILDQPVVEQQRAQQRGLGLDVLGELLDRGFGGPGARVEEDFGHERR